MTNDKPKTKTALEILRCDIQNTYNANRDTTAPPLPLLFNAILELAERLEALENDALRKPMKLDDKLEQMDRLGKIKLVDVERQPSTFNLGKGMAEGFSRMMSEPKFMAERKASTERMQAFLHMQAVADSAAIKRGMKKLSESQSSANEPRPSSDLLQQKQFNESIQTDERLDIAGRIDEHYKANGGYPVDRMPGYNIGTHASQTTNEPSAQVVELPDDGDTVDASYADKTGRLKRKRALDGLSAFIIRATKTGGDK